MAKKNGRPLKFQSVKKLQAQIEDYFESCWQEVPATRKDGSVIEEETEEGPKVLYIKKQIRPYTITGLAVHLGTTREILIHYQTLEDRKRFSNTIKKAKERCKNYAEEFTFTNNPTGAIFNLKCNYGYQDTTKIQHEVGTSITDLYEKVTDNSRAVPGPGEQAEVPAVETE